MTERYSLAPEGSKPRPEELDEDVVDYYQYSAARGDAAAQVCVSLCLCLCLVWRSLLGALVVVVMSNISTS